MEILTKEKMMGFRNLGRTYEVGIYNVSEISSCHLKMYYRRTTGIKEECNAKMALGKIIHYVLPDIIDVKGVVYETSLSGKFRGFEIRGTADAIYRDIVYEFKVTRLNRVTPSSVTQANMYCGLSGKKKANIVFINPDTMDVEYFTILFDKTHFNMMIDSVSLLHNSLLEEDPSSVTHSPSFPSECGFCAFRKVCVNENNLLL